MYIRSIEIDHEKCKTPYACKKCLQICPQAVFVVLPVKQEKFKETDAFEPGAWKLFTKYADNCSLCHDCLQVCPVNAIKITI